MKEKFLVIVLLIISTNATGQFIDRITFNYGFTKSDLEPVYEQDDTFPYYHYWGNQKIIGFFGGLDFDYFDSKFLAVSTEIAFYKKELSTCQ